MQKIGGWNIFPTLCRNLEMKKISLFIVAFIICPLCFSQEALKSVEEEYYDFLSLQGIVERPTLGYRTLSDSEWIFLPVEKMVENEYGTFTKVIISGSESDENLWKDNNLGKKYILWESESQGINWFSSGFYHGIKAKVFGPEWFNSYNTAAPYGQNDGALWQGVGYNSSLTGGMRLEAFGFEGTFKPVITFSQNKEFKLQHPGIYGNKYSYFWNGSIDLVQRFGDKSYFQFDWGDSEVRYTYHNFTVGFGTQSPWLGPAWLNPMLGSNNAGTYPKLDFGFRKTDIIVPKLGWNLGKFETRIWIGQLTESDYFDDNGKLDKNLMNGFYISYSPSFISGLTIGATKVCLTRWGNNFWRYVNPFYSSNDITGIGEDQKASVYVDWIFPKVGFEFYGEIGIDDYSYDFLVNPMHTLVYTVGFKKAFQKINSELIFEANNFEMSQDFQLQWEYMGYYAHAQILEGYTQRGQIIGAGTGYFGNSQYMSFKHYYKNGNITLFVHRYSNDMNYIYNQRFKADNKDSPSFKETYNKFYSKNRTTLAFGIDNSYIFNSNAILDMGICLNWIRNPYHELSIKDIFNYNFTCKLKYQF